MVPLQTAPPALGTAFVALVALVLVGGGAGAVGNAVARRLSNPVQKYRLLYVVVLVPVTLLAYGLLALLGFGPAVAAAAPTGAPFVGRVLGLAVEFLAAGLVWLAAYAPTVRGVREVRDVSLSTRVALVRMARYVVGLSAVVTVVVAPLRLLPVGNSPLALAVGVAAIGLVSLYASPWLVPVLRSTHVPAGGVADRLADLRSRAGLSVRDVRILDTDDEETARTLVRGPPGYRRLFVTSTFLDAFDDETAAALLAVEAGRLRRHVVELRVSSVVVAGVALVASLTGVGQRWPALGVAFGVLLVGFWLSRRGVRAADEDAAGRVGASAVAAALDRYAEVHAMDPTRRRLPNPLSANVALGDRIDRLRSRADE